ncbi:hypothetical protein ACIQ2D_15310 [Lysinibacillus sp. NPDC097287]|uniref:hypothetical protein n=1 Tax=Lysinibacillus sp. NPDC097287 TaxID=3364144 RepID=UPI00380177EE
MKKWLSYLFYFVVTIVVTYVFQWILVLLFGGIRFTAADSPPGDLSVGAKLVFSVGFPVFYFICLTIFFFLYRSLLKQFGFELNKVLPICFNIFIALGVVVRFMVIAFG